MDDGGRCQLVDVINDPQLLESFLENGAANNGANKSSSNNHKNHQSTGNQSQSTHKVTKKSAKPHSRVSHSPADGKNSKRKLEARQVDTVTSSDGGLPAIERVEEKKNSKNAGKSATARSVVPNPSPQTLSLHVPNSQAASSVMLPQQLLQMTPGAQLPQVVSGLGGQMILTRPQNQQGTGPLVQIIQTSNGPTAQLIPVSVQSSPSSGKSGSGQSTRAGNKQILPKPSSSPVAAPVSSLTVAAGAQNPVIRPALSVAGTPHAVTLTQNSVNSAAPQLILSGGQAPSLIQGPNGTFILNSGTLSGMGGQQLIFQNNGLGGMGSPFQLTIRAPSPQVIVSSSPSFQTSSPLLNALSQSSRTMPTQQTFVLQQNPAQAQTLFSPRTSHNMVWTRNTAPVISNPTIIQSPAAQPQQYISIQTANGPVLLPLAQTQSGPQIVPQSSQPISIPSNNALVQNFGGQFSGTTLQSLLTANAPATDLSHVTTSSASHSVIITTPAVQATSSGSKSNSSRKNSSSKGVNLADLLKESGILENSPPTSPNDGKQSSSSPDFAEPVMQQPPQQTVFMVPTGANQTPHNLVLTQSGLQTPGLNQLRLALTADGSMILQPSVPNVPAFSCVQQPVPVTEEAAGCRKGSEMAKDQVLGASQPSPDSTTPTLDATPQSAGTTDQSSGAGSDKSNEKLEAEGKATIPMTVTDINSTNESQKAKCVREEVNRGNESPANSSSPATAVIRTPNCDNQSSTLPVFMSSDPASKKADGVVATAAATAGPVMQISLGDKAFMEGLEAQIKGLASISSATEQQKSQLRELQNLQNQISEAKKNQAFNPSENVKMLLGVPAVRVAGQEQQQIYQTTHVVQTNTQSGQQSQQPQNVHLVNLLKPQTGIGVPPGGPAAIRLVSPSVVTAVSETPTFQLMGNQLITITSPAKNQMQSIQTAASQTKMSLSNTPVIQVVRLQTTQANTVTPTPVRPAPGKAGDPALDQEKRKQKTLKFFNQQLAADQTAALRPDYKTPFKSLDDACKRLLRYHVLQATTCSPSVLGKIDEDFETISRDLLIKKQLLVDRFRRCILRQSYQTEVSETVMLNKMFIADETSAIKFDKEVVAQGIPLDLPPPPRSWQHEIAARVHDEEREMSRKRKLPFLDEDLSEHLSEVKKQPIEPPVDKESDDGTEDEDDDSDDDDDDDANPGDDMSEYLGPNDNGNVDINSIYDEINYDPSLTSSDTRQGVDLDFCERSDSLPFAVQPSPQTEWRVGYDRNHWTPSTRFPEREAAVAVESILTSEDEEDDDDESGLSAMTALARQDDNEQDEEEDEDEEEDDDDEDDGEDEDEEEENSAVGSHPYPDFSETGLQDQQPVDSCDPQIQCAIDSILVDLPQQPSHQPFFHADSYGRPYAAMSGGMSVGHRTGLTSFGHSLQINDPALDEAVKSILS